MSGSPLKVARRIEYWRRRRGLSKSQLGRLSGHNKSQISRWTRGMPMQTDSLERIICALGVTSKQFFGPLKHRA
jgi:transcriptional regulator with XRE-family HTH domain